MHILGTMKILALYRSRPVLRYRTSDLADELLAGNFYEGRLVQ